MAGKKYREALTKIDRHKTYDYQEAIKLAKETSVTKFDSSVEACFNLNIDPRQAEQNIRGAMVLPNGTGKSRKVLVITQGPKEEEAKAAGADYVGGKDMLEKIQGGWFEILYAGIMSCGVAYTLQVVGQKDVEPTLASMILCLESVFAVIAGAILLGETMGPREIIGCVLMFVAIMVAQLPSKDPAAEIEKK